MKKTEQRKKEDCELLYDLMTRFDAIEKYSFLDINEIVLDFKKDNDLLPTPKLKLNRWIVDNRYPEWMCKITENNAFGINSEGDWFEEEYLEDHKILHKTERYATTEEILEKLTKIAIKKGYTTKQSECLTVSLECKIDFNNCKIIYNGSLWLISGSDSNKILDENGNWAKFIEDPEETKSTLEAAINVWKALEVLKQVVEISKASNKQSKSTKEAIEALTEAGYIVTIEKK
jgi:hypothetical protein